MSCLHPAPFLQLSVSSGAAALQASMFLLFQLLLFMSLLPIPAAPPISDFMLPTLNYCAPTISHCQTVLFPQMWKNAAYVYRMGRQIVSVRVALPVLINRPQFLMTQTQWNFMSASCSNLRSLSVGVSLPHGDSGPRLLPYCGFSVAQDSESSESQ